MKTLFIIAMLLLVTGCVFDHSHIPFCKDEYKHGMDCHTFLYGALFDDYNFSEAVCKQRRAYGSSVEMEFCFDTLEDMKNRLFNETLNESFK